MDYLEILKNVDPVTLIVVLFGYFNLKNRIKDLDVKMASKDDIKNLEQQIFDVDKLLCCIEGALSTKECCI